MAAYHRLIPPSSTIRANHTPHISHIQYYLFLIASFLPQLPSPLFVFLYTATSVVLSPHSFFFYPSQSFNPKPCMFCKHTHSHLYFHPCLFSRRPLPVFVYISHHALYLDLPLMKALDWAETSGKNCDNRHLPLDFLG